MITQTKRTQRGFSLNESMISLTLLSSGLLALAQFQGQAQQNSGHTKTQTTAVNLAQQKLETLRDQASTDYAGIVSNSDSPLTHTGDNTGFSRHWTVTPHTSPDYKEVSVTTDWQSTDGAARSVTISSFLAPSTPYTAGHGAGSTSNGEAAEDDAFPGQESTLKEMEAWKPTQHGTQPASARVAAQPNRHNWMPEAATRPARTPAAKPSGNTIRRVPAKATTASSSLSAGRVE